MRGVHIGVPPEHAHVSFVAVAHCALAWAAPVNRLCFTQLATADIFTTGDGLPFKMYGDR